MIMCPKCGKEIYKVQVSSRCHQTGTLGDKPGENEVLDYYDTEVEGGGEENIYCLECGQEITGSIKTC